MSRAAATALRADRRRRGSRSHTKKPPAGSSNVNGRRDRARRTAPRGAPRTGRDPGVHEIVEAPGADDLADHHRREVVAAAARVEHAASGDLGRRRRRGAVRYPTRSPARSTWRTTRVGSRRSGRCAMHRRRCRRHGVAVDVVVDHGRRRAVAATCEQLLGAAAVEAPPGRVGERRHEVQQAVAAPARGAAAAAARELVRIGPIGVAGEADDAEAVVARRSAARGSRSAARRTRRRRERRSSDRTRSSPPELPAVISTSSASIGWSTAAVSARRRPPGRPSRRRARRRSAPSSPRLSSTAAVASATTSAGERRRVGMTPGQVDHARRCGRTARRRRARAIDRPRRRAGPRPTVCEMFIERPLAPFTHSAN